MELLLSISNLLLTEINSELDTNSHGASNFSKQ